MTGSPWRTRVQVLPSGRRLELRDGREPLSFGRLFARLETDPGFSDWYAGALRGCGLAAYFWEHPPLTAECLDRPAELVLIESPALEGLPADPGAFAAHFRARPDEAVLTFPNLGGDALLIVPRPVGPREAYAHLGCFVRDAPREQVRALWATTARVVRENLGAAPRWLSTSGLGVPWLHLRLDSRPKYYQHRPYAVERRGVTRPRPAPGD